MNFTDRERVILGYIKKISLSPSHDLSHSLNTAEYARSLLKIYKGNREVIIAAALIHDLGRINKTLKGIKSAVRSTKLATPILQKAGYSKKEIRFILKIVLEHDQPNLHSETVESKILKDADFLDSFGARGILRAGMHTGETGGSINEAIERLQNKNKKRVQGVEFLETKRIAWKLRRFTEIFLGELKEIQNLSKVSYSGKLIVFEGISGSGKDTQAQLLIDYLSNKNIKTELIKYPTNDIRNLWKYWREITNDPKSESFLMLADMINTTNKTVLKALRNGKMVVCIRSSISTQVYQYINSANEYLMRYISTFEPIADSIIYLDINTNEGFSRARKQDSTNNENSFFGVLQQKQKTRYKKILANYPNVVIINGNKNRQEVHEEIVLKIFKLLND